MKKTISFLCVMLMLFGVICSYPITSQAADKVLPTDVTKPSSGCSLVGIKGSFIVDAKAAVDLVNKYRKEACNNGIRDPRNESRKLTSSDYVPIQWSSDLEYVARIRAAEANVITSHTRANGKDCWSLSSPNDVFNCGEVLAWNYSKSMLYGVEQWYEEKNDWIKNTGGVTGHYTQMIDPDNLYIGLGTFYSSDGAFPNCTAGRFSCDENLDTTVGSSVSNCIQTIEIKNKHLSAPTLKKTSGASTFRVGGSASYKVIYKVNSDFGSSVVTPLDDIKWTSSNNSVATVTNGKVNFLKAGKATIKATLSNDTTASVAIKVYPKVPPKSKIVKLTPKKTSVKLKWNKSEGASGYEIQYAKKANFSGKKTVKITKATTLSKTISKLSRKTKYYFRIRAFTKSSVGTVYSKWSAKKSTKTK